MEPTRRTCSFLHDAHDDGIWKPRPAENPGQSFALAEMLIGELFLATTVAKVINTYQPAKRGHAVEESDSASDEPHPDDDP